VRGLVTHSVTRVDERPEDDPDCPARSTAAWRACGGAIDPATGRGASVGLDLHVFTKGAQAVSIWTDAEPVI
jgi:hypothetical protein